MSKGSRPRPIEVPRDTFRNNWDQIFGRNATQPQQHPQEKPPSDQEKIKRTK